MTTKLEEIKLNMGEFNQSINLEQGEKKENAYHNHMTMQDEIPLPWAIALTRTVHTSESIEVIVYAQTEGEAIDIVTHHQEYDTLEELEGGDYAERDDWDDEYEEWEQVTSPRHEYFQDRDMYKARIEAFKNIDKCKELNPHLHNSKSEAL
tara:strand:+ start:122 stop:574 length:453 start_codon:yes stop_codon:yes gene_type:complete